MLLKHVEQGDKGKGQTVWGPLNPETTFLFCSEDSGIPLEVLKLEISDHREKVDWLGSKNVRS